MLRGVLILFSTLLVFQSTAQTLALDTLTGSDSTKVELLIVMADRLDEDKKDQAIHYCLQSLALADEIGYKIGVGKSAWRLGKMYSSRGDYQKAVDHLISALTVYEEVDDKERTAACLKALGSAFFHQESFDKALQYHFKALLIFQQLGDKEGMAGQYGNIGNLYLFQNSFDMAEEHFQNALVLFKELDSENGAAKCYGALATVNNKRGEHDKALKFYLKSLDIFQYQNDQHGLVTTLNNIGSNYKAINQPKIAIKYLKQAQEMGEKIEANEMLKRVYMNLAESYAMIKDFEKAYEYEVMFAVKEDDLRNENIQKQISEVEAKYKMARHQAELELVTKDKELANAEVEKGRIEKDQIQITLYVISGTLCIAGVMMLMLYRSSQQRKKAFKLVVQQSKDIRRKNQDLRRLNSEITYQKDQIQSSIEYAKRIQDAILPSNVRFKKLLPNSFVLYKPRDIVSGDFYWITEVRSKIVVAAIDCTGHGVPGAFLSMIGNEQLNRIVNQQGHTDSNTILGELNRGITRALKQEETMNQDGMDIALLVIDRATGTVQFSGAKSPLIYFVDGKLTRIKGDNKPVGGISEEETRTYEKHEIKVDKPTTFYIYSDGYQDQFGGPKGKKYNTVRFRAVLEEQHLRPIAEQHHFLDNEIVDWMMETDEMQVDDILVIGIKVDPVR